MASPGGSSNTNSSGSAIVALCSAFLGAATATFACYLLQKDTISSTQADETKVGGNNTSSAASSVGSSIPSPSDTVALICNRRSIFPKQYSGEALPRELINDMLNAARFAPTHKLTEAWRFVVFESTAARSELGNFMAGQYKSAQEAGGKEVVQAKYEKKIKNCEMSSHVLAVVVNTESKNPAWEEIASVSMAVQNMLLVAASHGAGAYWSSGSVVDDIDMNEMPKNSITTVFNSSWVDLLMLEENEYCLGLVFVGKCKQGLKWPSGKRTDIADKVEWR